MQQIVGLEVFTCQHIYSHARHVSMVLTVLNAKPCGQVFGDKAGSGEDCCQRAAEYDCHESDSI